MSRPRHGVSDGDEVPDEDDEERISTNEERRTTATSASSKSDSSSEHHDKTVLDRTALMHCNADELAKIDCDFATLDEKLAYYRATKGSVEKATRRLRETHEWRSEMEIDQIMKDPFWLQKERECRKLLKYDFLGTDKYGRPLMVERVGAWNVSDIIDAASTKSVDKKDDPDLPPSKKNSFLTLHCMACETLVQMQRPPDAVDKRGQIIIMDCMGLSARHLDPRLMKPFGQFSKNDAAHYPDTLAHIFVVNAPYIFSALATMISPFMDPDTYSKVHISSGLPDELLKIVGADCLPLELGGKRERLFPYDEEGELSKHPISCSSQLQQKTIVDKTF